MLREPEKEKGQIKSDMKRWREKEREMGKGRQRERKGVEIQRGTDREKYRDKMGEIERKREAKRERYREKNETIRKIQREKRYRIRFLLCNIYYSIILFYVIYWQKD